MNENATQIVLNPERLVLAVGNDDNAGESKVQSKYFLEVQDLVRNSTDAFFYNCGNESTNTTEDYESDDCNDTASAFFDEAMDIYIESMIKVEEDLKLNTLKILVSVEDGCVADSSTEQNQQDIEQYAQDTYQDAQDIEQYPQDTEQDLHDTEKDSQSTEQDTEEETKVRRKRDTASGETESLSSCRISYGSQLKKKRSIEYKEAKNSFKEVFWIAQKERMAAVFNDIQRRITDLFPSMDKDLKHEVTRTIREQFGSLVNYTVGIVFDEAGKKLF